MNPLFTPRDDAAPARTTQAVLPPGPRPFSLNPGAECHWIGVVYQDERVARVQVLKDREDGGRLSARREQAHIQRIEGGGGHIGQ